MSSTALSEKRVQQYMRSSAAFDSGSGQKSIVGLIRSNGSPLAAANRARGVSRRGHGQEPQLSSHRRQTESQHAGSSLRRIVDVIDLFHVRLPLREPFETSLGVLKEKEAVLVRVEHDGAVGWGEVVAWQHPWFTSESVDTALHVLQHYLIPPVLSATTANPPVTGHPMAKAGLDTALLDLQAKQLGVSLSEHLSGMHAVISSGISIGIQNGLAPLLSRVESALAEGYRRIKVKIRPGWDATPIDAIRRTFGRDFSLSVDANGAYACDDIEQLQALSDFGLAMIEQPFPARDYMTHASLQRRTSTAICLDEGVTSVADIETADALAAGRMINIKLGRVGGMMRAVTLNQLAGERAMATFCGGMLETGVGRAANLAFASVLDGDAVHDISPSDRYFAQDLITQPIQMVRPGEILVPDGHGIGVEVDEPRIDAVSLKHLRFSGEHVRSLR